MKAEEYLKKRNEFDRVEILERLEGEHNHSVVFSSGGEKYILRAVKENHPEGGALENKRNILEFLEEQCIEFAPRSILYEDDENVHITSYVGAKDAKIEELSDQELQDLAEKLAKLHELEFEKYVEFCEARNMGAPESETYADRIQYIREKLEALNPSNELFDWIRRNLDLLENNFSDVTEETGVRHADLPGSIRIMDGKIFLIDWEFAVFSYHPSMDLADIYVDEQISDEKFEKIKQVYLKERELESIETEIRIGGKIRILLNASWALGRAEKLDSEEESTKYLEFAATQKEKFRQLTG